MWLMTCIVLINIVLLIYVLCRIRAVFDQLDPKETMFISKCILIMVSFADGPAEDLYGIFINRVRRERPPELLETVRG